MRGQKPLLWAGLILSVLACALTLVGGALALFLLNTGAAGDLRLTLTVWVASFAGTFALSVMFFIFMLRARRLGS